MPRVLFTRENAREFSRRANQKRWSRFRAEKLALKEISGQRTGSANVVHDEYTSKTLALVREQISKTRGILNDSKDRYCEHCERGGLDGKARASLLTALDKLLDRERILLQLPLPGNLRPVQPSRKLQASQPAAPCGVPGAVGPSDRGIHSDIPQLP